MTPDAPPDALARPIATLARLAANVETVLRGKHEQLQLVLAALAADGHVLLEDVPGTAKTVLARALAGSVEGATVSRIQCTPDLQPTDITGLSVWEQHERTFRFREGPVFSHLVLVDEINRAMPKTQSALLEAMAERQVTVDGEPRPLPAPFLLLATENPVEQEGTFPLPEAQLDRFLLRTALGYPSAAEEIAIVRSQRHGHPLGRLHPVVALEEVRAAQRAVEDVHIEDALVHWIVDLVRATRTLDGVVLGASVRGSLALEQSARALALVRGRPFVVPADIEALLVPVLAHRVLLSPRLLAEGRREGREAILERFVAALTAAAPRPAPPPRRGLAEVA